MKKQTPAKPIRFRRKPLITALEPRILLDGAAVATTAEMTTDVAFQDEAVHTEAADQSVHFAAPAPTGSEPGSRREVAFVDTSVEDHQSLVDGLGDNVEVMLIDGSENGLEQMVAALQGQSGIDAIHLFSHGDVGELKLGTLTLNGETLAANAELLSTLGASLSEAGDLMLYGCYVGADSEGQSFIDSVAELTQADVAASEDLTGAESLGGDWELEAESGSVETDEISVAGFRGTLEGLEYVDLNNWSAEGDPNSNWQVQPGGRTVYQSYNGSKTYFVSPEDGVINRTVQGTIKVDASQSDNDFIGFTVGYQNSNNNIVFAWDKGGWGLSGYGYELWQNDNGTITHLASDVSSDPSKGWQNGITYEFRILYMENRIRAQIDGVTIFDVAGSFDPGKFGFFNESQGNVTYGNVRSAPGSLDPVVPVVADDIYGVNQNSNFGVDRFSGLLANDYDPNLDLFDLVVEGHTFASTSESHTFTTANGSVTVFGNGSFYYTPDTGFTGVETFNYYLVDKDGNSDTATVTLNVMEPNVAPTDISIDNDTIPHNASNGDVVGNLATTDGNSFDSHDYILLDNSGGRFSVSGNEIRVADATLLQPGNYTVSVRTTDLRGASYDENITITVSNAAPVMDAPTGGTVTDTEALDTFDPMTGTLTGSDTDSGSLSFGIQGGTDNGTTVTLAGNYGTLQVVKATGAYTYTPGSNAVNALSNSATDDFTVTVADAYGASDSETLTFNINGANDAPVFGTITQVDDTTTPPDMSGGVAPGAGTEVLDNGLLKFGNSVQDSINAVTGMLEQPFYYQNGSPLQLTYSNYALNLGLGVNGDGTNDWNLNGDVNLSPSFTNITVDTSSFSSGSGTLVWQGDITINGAQLQITHIYELPADSAYIETRTYVTNIGAADATNLRVWVGTRDDYIAGTDSPAKQKGNLVGGSFEVNTAVGQQGKAIKVYSGNEAILFYSTSEKADTIIAPGYGWNTSSSYSPGIDPSLSAYEQSPDDGGYAMYVRLDDLAAGETQSFDWFYAAGSNQQIDAIIADVSAAASANLVEGGQLIETGEYTVSDVDDGDVVTLAPTSVAVERFDTQGNPMAAGSSVPDQATLLAMMSVTPTTVIDAVSTTGNFDWNFDAGSEGFDFLTQGETLKLSFTLTAEDASGATATQVVEVTIEGINDAPVAQGSTEIVAENGVFNGNASATDVDGTIDSFALISTVSSGSLTFDPTDGSYSFDPGTAFDDLAEGEVRPVTFTYRAIDSSGAASEAVTVTLNVTGSNDVPVVSASSGAVSENGSLSSSVPVATDVDGTIAGYQLVNDVSSGSLTFNSNGSYSFDPGTDFDDLAVGESRQVSFTYTATDNDGSVSAPGTVTFTITGTNDAPTITAAAAVPITEVAGDSSAQDLSDSGAVDFGDLDTTDVVDVTFANNNDILWNGGSLTEAQKTALLGGFSIPATTDAAAPGSVNWTYALNDMDLDFLAVGETITFSYTVTADDGNGGTATDVVSFTLTGTNDAPTVSAAAASAITEAVDAGAQDLSDSGEVSFADLDSNDLIDIRFASNGDIAWSGATIDQPLDADLAAALVAGFSVSATDAEAPGSVNWTYSVDNADLDFLAVGETITFSYTVTADDGNGGTATDVVSFTLTGTNDAPTITAAAAAPITEAVDAGAQDLSDSGEVSFADLDSNDLIDIRFASNGDIAWSGATIDQPLDADLAAALVAGFSVSATDAEAPGSVNWTYALNDMDLDFLAVGETISFSYTVTADDGNGGTATDVVSFTLTGTNDAPTITAAAAAPITEAVDAGAQDLSDSGEVSFADLDSNDLIDIRFASNGDIAWSGATIDQPLDADLAAALVAGFSVSATDAEAPGSVNWTYSVDNADLDFLAVGETISFSYTVTADDGNGGTATDVVSFTLTGNDAPTVSAAAASAITEAVDAGAQDLSDSGEVSFADLDSTDLIDISFQANNDISWSGATLDQPLDADLAAALVAGFSVSATDAEAPGKVNWTYSVDNADLDFLAVGETITFSYTVTADDGNGGTATDVVSFILTGTNDAPTVSAAAASGITEAVDAGAQDLSDSGEVSFADLDSNDLIDIRFASNGDIAWSGATLDQPLDADLAAALVAGFSVAASDAAAPGSVNWTYSVDNADLDFLAVGETISFSYTVTADDGNGGTATDVVSFTLTGTNDAPTVSAAAASGITEAVDAGAQDLSDSGEVSFADLDSNDLIDIRFASNGDIAWSGASLDQPLDADLAAALVAGFSVAASDAAAPGSVNWTYSVDNADLDFLAVGETISFSYTVTADDGNGGSATDVVSFTLTGTNDAPTLSVAAASAITEAVDAGAQDLSDSGEVSFADLDSNDLIDIRFASNGDIVWSGATLDQPLDADLAAALVAGFSVSATDAEAPGKVNWTYSVDNADLDFLAVGETISFSYTVTADDGNGGSATDVVSFTLTGTNDTPTVSAAAASGITEAVDAGAQDLSDSGEVSFADLDSNDLIDIRFAANGDIAWSGATLDQPLDADLAAALVAGFSVSATDAEAPGSVNWTYSVDNADLDFLAVGETISFSYTVTADDGNGGSATDVVSFTLTGTNDAPTLSVAAASAITEAVDAGAQDLSDSGEVSFADLDSNDLIDIRFASNGDIVWSGATLDQPLDADLAAALVAGFSVSATDAEAPGKVNWTYSVDNADLDFLAVGETISFSYTVTADDGNGGSATDVVSFTLTGTNDTPTVSAAAASGITEAVDAGAQDLSDSGEVSFADLDSNDLIDIRFAANGDIAWSGATLDQPLDADLAAALVAGFSVSATDAEAPGSVNWTYSVDNADLDFLAVGETISFSYTVTADDGNGGTATDVVSFTLTGTNDAPTITATAAAPISEAVDAGAQDLSDSGEVSFADLDSNDLIDIRFAANGDIAWSGATLDQPLDADLAAALVAGFSVSATDAEAPGSVNWTYSVDNADLDFLAVGETLTFSYTVTADDGNGGTATDVVSFTLTGTNDAPTVSAAAASAITEAVDAGAQDLSDSGEVSFADLDSNDLIDIRFASNGDIAWSGATIDQPLDADLAAALVAGFSVSATDAEAPGKVNWHYSVDNADLDFLAVGETLTFSYTVTADDGNGGTATDVVSFTLTGTNDAPTITAAAAAPITEAVDAGAQDLSDSGEVSFADLDSNDRIDIRFAANGDIAWSGATLDQPLDADLAAALVAGFSVSATDAEAPGSVNWTYSVDNADLDFLAVGETITFSYTVTADDGNGGTATDVVSFTLTGTNDAPEVTADNAGPFVESEAASAQDLSGSGSVNFTDKDLTDDIDISFVSNEDIRWSRQDGSEVAELPAGLVSALLDGFTVGADNQPHNGQINWTYDAGSLDLDFLNEGDQITFSYTVTAQDSQGASADTVVTVTLVGSNDAPEMTARQMTDGETIVQQGADYTVEVASLFSDKDSTLSREDLDFTITGLPAGVSYDPLTGVISGKPTESGAFTIIVTASDAEGASLSRSYGMTVTAVVAEDGATGSGEMTPPPAPDTDSQPVKNDLSGMPDGLVGNQDGSNDPADSSGFMQPSLVEPESGNDDVDQEPDQPVSEPQDGGGDGDGATEQVILSEPGALVVESKSSDGSTSVRASVDVNVNASGQVEFSQDQQNAFETVSLAVASINNSAEGQLVIAIEDTSTTASSQLYSGGLSNGEQLPGWIQLDPITGSVTIANPPAGQKEVSIRIQAVGIDGQVRVLELKLDLEELLKRPVAGEGTEIDADTAGFVPLNDQLEAELAARDQYGDRLMAMLQSV